MALHWSDPSSDYKRGMDLEGVGLDGGRGSVTGRGEVKGLAVEGKGEERGEVRVRGETNVILGSDTYDLTWHLLANSASLMPFAAWGDRGTNMANDFQFQRRLCQFFNVSTLQC